MSEVKQIDKYRIEVDGVEYIAMPSEHARAVRTGKENTSDEDEYIRRVDRAIQLGLAIFDGIDGSLRIPFRIWREHDKKQYEIQVSLKN